MWAKCGLTSILCGLVAGTVARRTDATRRTQLSAGMTFSKYVQKYNRTYEEKEYNMREALFKQRVTEIDDLNSRKDIKWMSGINKLTDRTHEELSRLHGYRRHAKGVHGRPSAFFLDEGDVVSVRRELPIEVSWRHKLQSMEKADDQGGCGSCWAIVAARVMGAHSELYQTYKKFSVQQLLSCTPNPNECGGKGGCDGATVELAFEHIMDGGLLEEYQLPYTAKDDKCPAAVTSLMSLPSAERDLHLASSGIGLLGWQKLPENSLEPVKQALVERGPLAAAVLAADSWSYYVSGILEGCPPGGVLNHAVVLAGYGEFRPKKKLLNRFLATAGLEDKPHPQYYWLVQNSWGDDWGEEGYIRLMRQEDGEEGKYCGWDLNPKEGSGCKGGPDKVWVCGTCGIIYDVAVPQFRLSKDGWWATKGGRTVMPAY